MDKKQRLCFKETDKEQKVGFKHLRGDLKTIVVFVWFMIGIYAMYFINGVMQGLAAY